MAIRKLHLANFKSFDKLDLELDSFQVIIGANASGKSNLIQVFKFLRDIGDYGLESAVALQGGVKYLRNLQLGRDQDLVVDVEFDLHSRFSLPFMGGASLMSTVELHRGRYRFSLQFDDQGSFSVGEDRLELRCRLGGALMEGDEVQEEEQLDSVLTIANEQGKNVVDFQLPGLDIDPTPVLSFLFQEEGHPHSLLCQRTFPPLLPHKLFGSLSIYDLDPKLAKKATQITGKVELEEDGSNLAIALQHLLENPDRRQRFFRLLQDLLPFVDDLVAEQHADRSLLLKLAENYSPGHMIPAPSLSDGTIQIAAIILALYFQNNDLAVVEEPEKSLHPHLLSRLVELMVDASHYRQILTTTHNPELLKYADLDQILLISRSQEGFSQVSRPGQNEEVRLFLEQEMGMDELYVQNLLGPHQ